MSNYASYIQSKYASYILSKYASYILSKYISCIQWRYASYILSTVDILHMWNKHTDVTSLKMRYCIITLLKPSAQLQFAYVALFQKISRNSQFLCVMAFDFSNVLHTGIWNKDMLIFFGLFPVAGDLQANNLQWRQLLWTTKVTRTRSPIP